MGLDPVPSTEGQHEGAEGKQHGRSRAEGKAADSPTVCLVAEYEGTECVMVRGSAQSCFDALTDFERLPEWQRAVSRCTVVSRDADGSGAVVEYEVDARVRTVRYRLANRWEAPVRLHCEYLDGDFRSFRGGWTFDEREPGCTEVTVTIGVDPGRFVPRPVVAVIRKAVLRQAVEDLRRYVEESSSGS